MAFCSIPAQEFYVQLSEKPTGNVTVRINNAATSDIVGFDRCTLVFTDVNWATPQVVYAVCKAEFKFN